MKRYDPKAIEPKWQKTWAETKLYEVKDDDPRPKWYQLEFFPYPSGVTMHVGHVRNYVISDAFARYKRMTGHNVLHPMGWDAFGLPAENQAIKTGQPPAESTAANVKVFKRQLNQVGLSYDWSRELNSSDPSYYRWNQWLFLLFLKKGLAYKAEAAVNWCPHDKTVLANEQVIKKDGKSVCERCGHEVEKRFLSQWFFRITEYADRLLDDLDEIDWPEGVKAMQRNWIGRSVGAEIEFSLHGIKGQEDGRHRVKVFTTRADTLAGATFLVVSPELANTWIEVGWQASEKVTRYIKKAMTTSEIERQDESRGKTGVDSGIKAVNPLTQQEIPVWVADYVLGGYGTGAIMAVPAHDERDYEFAKEFGLEIRPVVAEVFLEQDSPLREGFEMVARVAVQAIVEHPEDGSYLLLKRKAWKDSKHPSFVTGGVEEGEEVVKAALRELEEEAGYTDVESATLLDYVCQPLFFHEVKQLNRRAIMHTVVIKLKSLKQATISEEEKALNEPVWVSQKEVETKVFGEGCKKAFAVAHGNASIFMGEGVLINSGDFNGTESSDAREKVTAKFGAEKVNYKMRDWLFGRQRYWGTPIPVVYCENDGIVPVPEDQLPVELPPLKTYQPADDGRSPLARAKDWLHTTCPKCGGPAERETDTMDGFVDSSWYFLRFADPHNTKLPFSADVANHWMPVDNYVGGVEHAVMHLLFARFWMKVFYDEKMVDAHEPFKRLRNQGMIGAADGRKMSKRYGNVVTPEDIIEQGYGADSLRLYELFIGPYDQGVDWNPNGIDGTKRFLNRVWTLVQDHLGSKSDTDNTGADEALEAAISSATHRALKRVTFDLEDFGFNTAIAAMMGLVNELYKLKTRLPLGTQVWHDSLRLLTQMLAPFAPHIAEELWQDLGGESSVHVSGWPTFDPELVKEELVNVVLQVNGKVRGQLEIEADASEEQIKQAAEASENVQRNVKGKTIVKTIYVPHKLVNFVVK